MEKYDYNNSDFNQHVGEFREFVRKNYEDEFVLASFNADALEEEYKDIEKNGLLGGLIQDLIKYDNFFEAVNIVDDGKISDQEIKAFLKGANTLDNDFLNTSFDEVLQAFNDVKDGKIGKADFQKHYGDTDVANTTNPFAEETNTEEQNSNIPSITLNDYSGLNESELNNVIEAESAVTQNAKTRIAEISSGKHSDLKSAKEAYEKARDEFAASTNLTEEEKLKLTNAENNEVIAQKARDDAQIAFDDNQVKLTACQTNLEIYKASYATASADLAAAESALNQPQTDEQGNPIEVPNPNLGQLRANVKALETAILALEAQEMALLSEKDKLEEDLANKETELTNAQQNVTDVAKELASQTENEQIALQNLITARNNYDAAQETALLKERDIHAQACANEYSARSSLAYLQAYQGFLN